MRTIPTPILYLRTYASRVVVNRAVFVGRLPSMKIEALSLHPQPRLGNGGTTGQGSEARRHPRRPDRVESVTGTSHSDPDPVARQ